MKRHPKSAKLLLMLLITLGIAGLAANRMLQMREDYELCERAEGQTLPGPDGKVIEVDTRFCSLLAGDPGTIVVRLKDSGWASGNIVFAYNPSSADPSDADPPWYPDITWRGPNEVVIAISRLSQIQRQRHNAGDVRVIYRIGKVDYP